MSQMTIDLSEMDAAVPALQARAARMAPERYLSHIITSALDRQRNRAADDLAQHLEAMGAQVQPETTPEEMEATLEEALAAVRPRRIRES